jgi:hypothetical protein
MKPFLSILSLLIFFSTIAFSQANVDDALKTYFSRWQKGQSTTDVSEALLKMDLDNVFSKLEHLTTDTSQENRYATYRLIHYLGKKTTDPAIRKRAVKQLILGCKDKDSGIVGVILKELTSFATTDFDPESKYLLSEMAKKPMPYYELMIKICGWLDIKDLIYDFRQMIADKKGTVMQRWAMRLAMARMGEQDMLDYCMGRIRKIPVNDDVVYDLVPDMIYTRQKPMFNYLFQIIRSNDKSCSSPNPDSGAKILCGYRVMEQIAPYIQNFPVEVDKSGELKSGDYDKALQEARSWIKQNAASYTIKNEGY